MRSEQGSLPLPFALWASCAAAVFLSLYPLPAWLAPARPDWLALLVIYWVMRLPQGFGIGGAWLLGLTMDGLEGGVLGRHALALSVVAYACLLLRRRMLPYSLVQQMAVVCAICAMDQVLCYWVQGVVGHGTPGLMVVAGSLTAAFCWPILMLNSQRDRAFESWRSSS